MSPLVLAVLAAAAVLVAPQACEVNKQALPLLQWDLLNHNVRDLKISFVDSTLAVLANITTPVAVIAAMVRLHSPSYLMKVFGHMAFLTNVMSGMGLFPDDFERKFESPAVAAVTRLCQRIGTPSV